MINQKNQQRKSTTTNDTCFTTGNFETLKMMMEYWQQNMQSNITIFSKPSLISARHTDRKYTDKKTDLFTHYT